MAGVAKPPKAANLLRRQLHGRPWTLAHAVHFGFDGRAKENVHLSRAEIQTVSVRVFKESRETSPFVTLNLSGAGRRQGLAVQI